MSDLRARDPLFWCAVGSAVVLLLLLGWPLLLGELYVFSDLGRFHVPVRHFYAEALAAGESFLWFPYEFTGFYLHGEGQGAFTHPLNWLQYRMLPFHVAFSLELMRTYGLLLSGTFALLVRWRVPYGAASFAALLFSFGSFNFLHFAHMNFTAIVAHVPWLLLATDVALESVRPRPIALARFALVCLVASMGLHGHPQVMWMSLVVLGLYLAMWLAGGFPTDRPRSAGARVVALGPIGVAVVLGIALAAIQLWPQWDALGTSLRADPGRGHANRYALSPIDFLQLVAPYLFAGRTVGSNTAGFAFYAGAAVMPLVIWAVGRGRRLGALWPVLCFGALLAGLGALLALGEAGGLYRVQEMLPFVGLFRAPGRYVMMSEFGLALMAAAAFSDLARPNPDEPRPGWRRLWPLLIPFVVSVIAAFALTRPDVQAAHPDWATAGSRTIAIGGALMALATALVVLAARGHPAALFALVVLTAVDLGTYGLSYVRTLPTVELAAWVGYGDPPPVAPDERLERGPAVLTMRGVRLAGGYAAMTPQRVLPIARDEATDPAPDAAVVRASRRLAGIPLARSRGRDVPPLPRVRLVADAEATDDVLGRIGGIDVATSALVAKPLAMAPGPPGTVRVLVDRPGRLRVQTDVPDTRLLVFSERHHPGWRGDRGEVPCDVVPVYADFIGCVVPAGRHEIELVFEPRSYTLGRRISLLAGVVALAWSSLPLLGARRAPR